MSEHRPLAIVTGASRRVGRAICLLLAEQGYDIILTYRTSGDEAQRTACEVAQVAQASRLCTGQRPVPPPVPRTPEHLRLDLADLKEVEAFARRLAQRHERIDALIHNAAMYESSPWGSVTAESMLNHYRINAVAPLLLTQGLSEPLRRAGGSVVMLCDIHAMGRPRRRFTAYSMSKAAAVEMVRTLGREMAPEVRVNGIAPGVVAWPDGTEPAEIAGYEKRIPLGRSGEPDDAARAVLFLVREATYLTGEIVRVDGGRFLT
jgi:pteridine reductase